MFTPTEAPHGQACLLSGTHAQDFNPLCTYLGLNPLEHKGFLPSPTTLFAQKEIPVCSMGLSPNFELHCMLSEKEQRCKNPILFTLQH